MRDDTNSHLGPGRLHIKVTKNSSGEVVERRIQFVVPENVRQRTHAFSWGDQNVFVLGYETTDDSLGSLFEHKEGLVYDDGVESDEEDNLIEYVDVTEDLLVEMLKTVGDRRTRVTFENRHDRGLPREFRDKFEFLRDSLTGKMDSGVPLTPGRAGLADEDRDMFVRAIDKVLSEYRENEVKGPKLA